jgi:hypothetical protein
MSNSTLTPYSAHTIVNAELAKLHIIKKIPPQMMYQYVAKGYIPSIVVDGKKRIKEEDLRTWFVKYVTKFKVELRDENQLELF